MITKIVRSKIPSIAIENNKPGDFRVVNLRGFPGGDKLFKEKIVEEANEVLIAGNSEELLIELADLKQVIEDYMDFKNISSNDLYSVMLGKKATRGGFKAVHSPAVTDYLVQVMNPTKEMIERIEK